MSDIDRRRYTVRDDVLASYDDKRLAEEGDTYYHKSAVLELLTMLRLEHDHRRKTYGRVNDAGECDTCAVIAHYKRQFNE